MRKLTYYELQVLTLNEIKNLFNAVNNKFHIGYIQERAHDILQYCKEIEELEQAQDD
jgi:hypothetical protein